jgi:hypothetical protein
LTHRGVERAHVPPGRVDGLDHARAPQLDIAATRGGQQAPMRGNVGVAELLRGRAARLTADYSLLLRVSLLLDSRILCDQELKVFHKCWSYVGSALLEAD